MKKEQLYPKGLAWLIIRPLQDKENVRKSKELEKTRK